MIKESLAKLNSPNDWHDTYRNFASDIGAKRLTPLDYFRFMTTSKANFLENYSKYMDQTIEYSKFPYSHPLKSPPTPTDLFNQILVPVVPEARMKWVAMSSNQRLLTTLLAINLHKLETGKLPSNLSDLVPSALKSLPDDPFAPKGALGYKLIGDKMTLYSIGPDAVDDGGKPIDDPSKANPKYPNSHARYNVQDDSKGDIVAGKNAL